MTAAPPSPVPPHHTQDPFQRSPVIRCDACRRCRWDAPRRSPYCLHNGPYTFGPEPAAQIAARTGAEPRV